MSAGTTGVAAGMVRTANGRADRSTFGGGGPASESLGMGPDALRPLREREPDGASDAWARSGGALAAGGELVIDVLVFGERSTAALSGDGRDSERVAIDPADATKAIQASRILITTVSYSSSARRP